MSAKQIYEFGRFRLDADERLLLREGKPISLTPKAFETLLALVENSGHVVKKDDLMKRVWPDAVVEEVNLAKNVSTLRQALETNGEQYIETVSKLGYRLVVNARALSAPEHQAQVRSQAAGGPAMAPVQPVIPAVIESPANKKIRAIGMSLAAVALTGLAIIAYEARVTRVQPTPIRSLVVLPLTNLSGDASQEYFVDGITEVLTTEVAKLAKAAPLRVISRTTAMRYKNTSHAAPEIGRELKVDAVLEGAVVRSGERVRITAQLIRAANDEHMWAQSYDRNLVDALAVQGEIAQDIAKQIKLQITPELQAHGANRSLPSIQAQDAYLRARYEWNKRTPQSLLRARALFQQALELEPAYALAWTGLANTEYLLTSVGIEMVSPQEGIPKAKASARRALELDDGLGEAHASLAIITWAADWNWPAAEREYKRALELNPSDASAHQFYGIGLASQRRFEESIAEAKRAIELDPLSLIIDANFARMFYFARRYDEALTILRHTVQVDPHFFTAHEMLGLVELAAGQNDVATTELRRARELAPDSTFTLMNLARAYARAGQRQAALAALKDLTQTAKKRYVPSYQFAVVHAELGHIDLAFQWLDKALEEPSAMMMLINVEPTFDALRGDPRFTTAIKHVRPLT